MVFKVMREARTIRYFSVQIPIDNEDLLYHFALIFIHDVEIMNLYRKACQELNYDIDKLVKVRQMAELKELEELHAQMAPTRAQSLGYVKDRTGSYVRKTNDLPSDLWQLDVIVDNVPCTKTDASFSKPEPPSSPRHHLYGAMRLKDPPQLDLEDAVWVEGFSMFGEWTGKKKQDEAEWVPQSPSYSPTGDPPAPSASAENEDDVVMKEVPIPAPSPSTSGINQGVMEMSFTPHDRPLAKEAKLTPDAAVTVLKRRALTDEAVPGPSLYDAYVAERHVMKETTVQDDVLHVKSGLLTREYRFHQEFGVTVSTPSYGGKRSRYVHPYATRSRTKTCTLTIVKEVEGAPHFKLRECLPNGFVVGTNDNLTKGEFKSALSVIDARDKT